MAYTLRTSGNFEKDFYKLDVAIQSRVLIALEQIRINPFFQSKKLTNVERGKFRRRIGDYRLRFDVFGKEVFLYRIRHRKDVYR